MKISDFSHLQRFDAVRFKTEMVGDQAFTILCYMISDAALWDEPLGKETRGHVFDASGALVSMPFEKFFNYRENKFTQPSEVGHIRIRNVFEKRDGSLMTPVLVKHQVHWKTKKSFYSDVAIEAAANTKFVNQASLSAYLLCMDLTPIFEYTSRNFKIVVDYGHEPALTLLAIRVNATGEYMTWPAVTDVAQRFGVETVKRMDIEPGTTLDDLEHALETAEGVEGYVVELENGMRLKLKSPWYLRLHHVNTDLRERDIAEMFVDETLDDVKSTISLAGMTLDAVEAIESRVTHEMNDIMDRTRELKGWIQLQSSRKEAAEKFRGCDVFGLAMKLLDNKEPDYVTFWKRNFLKQNYSLTCVYNENFS